MWRNNGIDQTQTQNIMIHSAHFQAIALEFLTEKNSQRARIILIAVNLHELQQHQVRKRP